jgi:hypothetical protein
MGTLTDKDYAEFEALMPAPDMPKMLLPGNITVDDPNNEHYIKACRERMTKRAQFMFIKSLMHTPNLTLSKVVLDDPDTWVEVYQELKDEGLTSAESFRLQDGMYEAQGICQEKVDKATENFYARRNLGQQ